MSCKFSKEQIEQTISFHGHHCPGLAIGIRAAELAIRELGEPAEIKMVAVSETDMCGVDAIQYLTGCTFGKGNFIHRDFGKMAFSFFDRKSGRGFRALLNPEVKSDLNEELAELMRKTKNGTATEADRARQTELRDVLERRYMETALDTMFIMKKPGFALPRRARLFTSLACASCGEMVMESRTRRFDEKTMCIPCFEAVEQKI